jgi:hypothetical protein
MGPPGPLPAIVHLLEKNSYIQIYKNCSAFVKNRKIRFPENRSENKIKIR